MSQGQRGERRCPRCDAAMGKRERWCPECGHGEADEEERFVLGSGAADAVAVVCAVALPMVLVLVFGWLGVVWAATIAYLPVLAYLILLFGFFTFLQPFRTIRKTIAWVSLLWSLPTAFVSGCLAVTTGPEQWWLGIVTVITVAFQGLLFRWAYGRR